MTVSALYRWSEFFLGMPHCLDAENLKELDCNLSYSVTKEINQKYTSSR